MPQATIILYPERDRPARSGPYRFPYSKPVDPKAKEKNKSSEFELQGSWLHPGSQLVDMAEVVQLEKNANFQRCVKTGVIALIKPVAEQATGTTVDYDLSDVFDIIDNSADIEWLRSSAAKETRNEVASHCQTRIKDLEAQSKPVNQ